jgi:hypothetical protein
MITTGSVRGKCSALQAGQCRRHPPSTTSVLAPHAAKVSDDEIDASLQRVNTPRIDTKAEPTIGIDQTEKDPLSDFPKRLGFGLAKQRLVSAAAALENDHFAGDYIRRRARICGKGAQRVLI